MPAVSGCAGWLICGFASAGRSSVVSVESLVLVVFVFSVVVSSLLFLSDGVSGVGAGFSVLSTLSTFSTTIHGVAGATGSWTGALDAHHVSTIDAMMIVPPQTKRKTLDCVGICIYKQINIIILVIDASIANHTIPIIDRIHLTSFLFVLSERYCYASTTTAYTTPYPQARKNTYPQRYNQRQLSKKRNVYHQWCRNRDRCAGLYARQRPDRDRQYARRDDALSGDRDLTWPHPAQPSTLTHIAQIAGHQSPDCYQLWRLADVAVSFFVWRCDHWRCPRYRSDSHPHTRLYQQRNQSYPSYCYWSGIRDRRRLHPLPQRTQYYHGRRRNRSRARPTTCQSCYLNQLHRLHPTITSSH